MNEVFRIHLARVSYDIDVAAKKELEKYLTAVKKSLGSEADAMEDIEIRMTEILAERGVVKDSVITEADVKAIIAQLGEPNDFSSSDTEAKTAADSDSAKKYYRDSEHGVLGGVIAGLAAYTGWDVTILRIVAVLLLIIPTGVPIFIIYIVMWLVAPEAKTVSEKLEMRGEPVNLDSIKTAGQEMAAKASEIGKEIERNGPEIGKTISRAVMFVIGLVGIVVCALMLATLVLLSTKLFIALWGMNLVTKPLLFVVIGLALAFMFTLILMGITISAAFMGGKFGKSFGRSMVALLVMMLIFVTGAAIAGSSWSAVVGPSDTKQLEQVIRFDIPVKTHQQQWCVGLCK